MNANDQLCFGSLCSIIDVDAVEEAETVNSVLIILQSLKIERVTDGCGHFTEDDIVPCRFITRDPNGAHHKHRTVTAQLQLGGRRRKHPGGNEK